MSRILLAARPGAWASLACLSLLPGACRSPDPSGAAPSASAAVQPLDTSWEQTLSRLLAVGEKAPDFEGLAHTGMRVRLSRFLDAPVVVYFYQPGGASEDVALARGFRDQWLGLHDRASMILGVSTDDRISHRDFATELRLPFLLVSDGSLAIARAFGVPVTEGRVARSTFVVGKDGKVVRTFSPVSPEGHAQEVLTTLEGLPP